MQRRKEKKCLPKLNLARLNNIEETQRKQQHDDYENNCGRAQRGRRSVGREGGGGGRKSWGRKGEESSSSSSARHPYHHLNSSSQNAEHFHHSVSLPSSPRRPAQQQQYPRHSNHNPLSHRGTGRRRRRQRFRGHDHPGGKATSLLVEQQPPRQLHHRYRYNNNRGQRTTGMISGPLQTKKARHMYESGDGDGVPTVLNRQKMPLSARAPSSSTTNDRERWRSTRKGMSLASRGTRQGSGCGRGAGGSLTARGRKGHITTSAHNESSTARGVRHHTAVSPSSSTIPSFSRSQIRPQARTHAKAYTCSEAPSQLTATSTRHPVSERYYAHDYHCGASRSNVSAAKARRRIDGTRRKEQAFQHDPLQPNLYPTSSSSSFQLREKLGGLSLATRRSHARNKAIAWTKKEAKMECYPMTPSYVFAHHNGALSEYEKSEILEYSEIYYLGNQEKKLRVVAKEGERRSGDTISKHLVRNLGYDNERGDYNLVMFDHIAYRYEVLSVLGKGSFGIVVKVFDHKTQEMRALKIIRNLKRFHLQALVEGKILRHISERDPTGESNLIRVLDQFYFREHLCFTFRLFDINLYEWTRQRKYAGFALETVRVISKQILLALRFLRKESIIHSDIKPENILLRHPPPPLPRIPPPSSSFPSSSLLSSSEKRRGGKGQKRTVLQRGCYPYVTIIDLGSSCYENERVYTYIQSRFYRAPEVILGLSYGPPIDIWSFGCLCAELYTGHPLFPGEDEQEQLSCMMEVFGRPPESLLKRCSRYKVFFTSSGAPRFKANSRGRSRKPGSRDLRHCVGLVKPDGLSLSLTIRATHMAKTGKGENRKPKRRGEGREGSEGGDDEETCFLDFLNGCLRWDSDERMSPEEALRHPWMTWAK